MEPGPRHRIILKSQLLPRNEGIYYLGVVRALEFINSLVSSLAWPATIVVLALLFPEISESLPVRSRAAVAGWARRV